jgi:hypothetical protein
MSDDAFIGGVLSPTAMRDAEIARLRAERRERIATACLAGLMADPKVDGSPDDMSDCAVRFADALIARLDKETKP